MPVFSATSLHLSALSFDFSTLPALQSKCPYVQSMVSSPSLSVVSVPFLKSSILSDLPRVSPAASSFRSTPSAVHLFHGLLHPGVRASGRLLSSNFVWPGLSKDVGLWTRTCLRCQQSKIHVHLDLVGLLPSSQGFSYLLAMIDRTSRWPEAVPLSSIPSESALDLLSPLGYLDSEFLLS